MINVMVLGFFNTLFNDLVRNVDPVIKGLIALVCFGLGFWLFAKCIIVKMKSNVPFKIGYLILSILCFTIGIVYSIF